MAETTTETVAIDASVMDEGQRLAFIETFGRLLYSGTGSTSNFSRQLGVTESDGLRVLVGLPAQDLGEQQRRVFEAIYAYTLGLAPRPRPEIWTAEPGWTPINPRRSEERSIEQCQLDLEFVDSFPIRRSVWEKQILMADLKAIEGKIQRGGDLSAANLRLYIALAVFGIRDPSQFFV